MPKQQQRQQQEQSVTFLDIVRILPLHDFQQCVWDKLGFGDQHSLRCTCSALQQLAQEGLVTIFAFNVEHSGVDSAECLTMLFWSAHHYQALQEVQLSNVLLSPVTCSMLRAALRAAPRLHTIKVVDPICSEEEGFVSFCAALAAVPQLTALIIEAKALTLNQADTAALTAAICSLPRLIMLCLTFRRVTNVSAAGVSLLASIAALPELQLLRLCLMEEWRFTHSHMQALTAPSGLKQLKHLTLNHCDFTDTHVGQRFTKWLADGAALYLETLNLGGCDEFAESELMQQLCSANVWRAMTKLQQLVLSMLRINNNTVQLLANTLPYWTRLEVLSLAINSELSDSGARAVVEALIRAPHMRTLKEVNMQWCDVSDECQAALHKAWEGTPHLAGARLRF